MASSSPQVPDGPRRSTPPPHDAGLGAQTGLGIGDRREAVCQVIARTAVEPHTVTVLAGDDPNTVILDFMDPQIAGGRPAGPGGEARPDEPGRKDSRHAGVTGHPAPRNESRRMPWNGNPAAFLDPVAGLRGPSDSRVQLEGPLGQRLKLTPVSDKEKGHSGE
jgi:hypothetical protein